jgi:hypothetical protein
MTAQTIDTASGQPIQPVTITNTPNFNVSNTPSINPNNAIGTAPTVGQKNVTTTAAELFAGASTRVTSRYAMTVYNESNTTVYWGITGVTTANGFPLLPGDSVTFTFKPSVATAIYFIGSATASTRVVELA